MLFLLGSAVSATDSGTMIDPNRQCEAIKPVLMQQAVDIGVLDDIVVVPGRLQGKLLAKKLPAKAGSVPSLKHGNNGHHPAHARAYWPVKARCPVHCLGSF